MPERSGQRLRLALARHLGNDAGVPPRLILDVNYSEQREGVAVLNDSSLTRTRVTGSATFTLRAADGGTTCLSGTERAIDGTDVTNQQFFASDLQTDAALERLSDHVADGITRRIAVALDGATEPTCAGR